MADRKCYAVLDAEGFVIATHAGLEANPLEAPPGGSCIVVGEDSLARILSIFESGKRPQINSGYLNEVDRPTSTPPTEDLLKKARRDKLIEASTITHVRDKDDKDTGIYSPVGLRHLDIAALSLRGDLKDTDLIYVRNNKTGHEDRITVANWWESLLETFQLRQSLREREQVLRDQVEAIHDDGSKTDEQKVAEIQSIEIPKEVKDGK